MDEFPYHEKVEEVVGLVKGQVGKVTDTVSEHYMSPIHLQDDARPPQRILRAGFYPIQAIYYFLKTPALWKILLMPLLITAVVGIVAFVLIFGLALYPQELLFEETFGCPAWFSWIAAVLLCIGEVLLVILFTALIFVDGMRRRIYYKVFELEGITIDRGSHGVGDVTANKRMVSDRIDAINCCCCWVAADVVSSFEDCICCFLHPSELVWSLCSSFFSLILFVITFPLNFIPVIGTLGFCMVNGFFMAWRMQRKYFTKKGLSFKEQRYFVFRIYYGEILAFGTVCMLLDLIPIVDILLIYTNIVASALWAADMEKSGLLRNFSRLHKCMLQKEDSAPLISADGEMADPVTFTAYDSTGSSEDLTPSYGKVSATRFEEPGMTANVAGANLAAEVTDSGQSVVYF